MNSSTADLIAFFSLKNRRVTSHHNFVGDVDDDPEDEPEEEPETEPPVTYPLFHPDINFFLGTYLSIIGELASFSYLRDDNHLGNFSLDIRGGQHPGHRCHGVAKTPVQVHPRLHCRARGLRHPLLGGHSPHAHCHVFRGRPGPTFRGVR